MLSKNNKNSDRKRGCLREKGKESFVNITLSKKYDIVDEPLFLRKLIFLCIFMRDIFLKKSAGI